MKSLLKPAVFCLFTLFTLSLSAQKKKTEKLEFWVGGVCEMCKERIEKAVDVKGVIYANYNLDKHQLEIIYKPGVISEEEIHALLNKVGHDTESSKASKEEYGKIHHCCQYREHGKHDHH